MGQWWLLLTGEARNSKKAFTRLPNPHLASWCLMVFRCSPNNFWLGNGPKKNIRKINMYWNIVKPATLHPETLPQNELKLELEQLRWHSFIQHHNHQLLLQLWHMTTHGQGHVQGLGDSKNVRFSAEDGISSMINGHKEKEVNLWYQLYNPAASATLCSCSITEFISAKRHQKKQRFSFFVLNSPKNDQFISKMARICQNFGGSGTFFGRAPKFDVYALRPPTCCPLPASQSAAAQWSRSKGAAAKSSAWPPQGAGAPQRRQQKLLRLQRLKKNMPC